jgi:hypothetical protein
MVHMDAGGMDWVGVGPHTYAELGEGMAPTPERNLAEARGTRARSHGRNS